MSLNDTTYLLTKNQRTCIHLFVISMFISMNPWMTFFYLSATARMFIVSTLVVLAYLKSPSSFYANSKNLTISFLFLLAAFLGTRGNDNAFIGTAFRCLPFLLFIHTKKIIRRTLLVSFNKVYWWIITISLFFWILFLIGVPLPYGSLTSERVYTFDNYFFFVRATYVDTSATLSSFPRFCSIFLEPGYVACFIVFMLFVNNYDFKKWYNIVYLIALVFTFSVAGWLLFFVGLIPYITQRGKIKWSYWIFVGFLVFVFFYFSSSSDNVVGVLIGERIRFEDGSMVGYNRASLELEDYWNNYFWKSNRVLWGLGDDYNKMFDFGASVDLRAYVIRYGIVATVLYLVFMLLCFLQNRSRYGFWFFILVLAFVYRGYSIMFWDAMLFVYLSALTKMKEESMLV